MRIAISGAHSQGKSTLVWGWVKRHPDYIREEEPFRALHSEGYPIRFRQECTRLDNGIQQRLSMKSREPSNQAWIRLLRVDWA